MLPATAVAEALTRAGVTVLSVLTARDPQLEDDAIQLAGGYHVQVSADGYILVRENPDGTLTFFPSASAISMLLEQVAKAPL